MAYTKVLALLAAEAEGSQICVLPAQISETLLPNWIVNGAGVYLSGRVSLALIPSLGRNREIKSQQHYLPNHQWLFSTLQTAFWALGCPHVITWCASWSPSNWVSHPRLPAYISASVLWVSCSVVTRTHFRAGASGHGTAVVLAVSLPTSIVLHMSAEPCVCSLCHQVPSPEGAVTVIRLNAKVSVYCVFAFCYLENIILCTHQRTKLQYSLNLLIGFMFNSRISNTSFHKIESKAQFRKEGSSEA